ncbi:MAG: sigma-70 family RNA polymerase sigma factor [Lachnospiraceae bacterium]|nr:sigma-70 family RNA polymerase sigma factor [Lachnospiraceae bacterium]
MHYRDTQAEILGLEEDLALQAPGSPAALLSRRRILKARLDCLKTEKAIASLPSPRLRRILSLRYLEGLSWREMTDPLALSESSLYQLHRKALAMLEQQPPAP